MKKLESHIVGIDQGSEVLFSHYEDGGRMWTGGGSRTIRKKIKFSEEYAEIPTVQVAMSMWDVDHERNQRADLYADKITKVGFDLVFRTWADSRVARVRADWMSIGPLPHEDNWDVG